MVNLIYLDSGRGFFAKELLNHKFIGDLYSNFDHELDHEIALRLKEGNFYTKHYAENYLAIIWYENEKYNSYVLQYLNLIGEFTANTAEDLIKLHIEKFGSD